MLDRVRVCRVSMLYRLVEVYTSYNVVSAVRCRSVAVVCVCPMSDVLVENALVRAPWANEKVCGTISAYLGSYTL